MTKHILNSDCLNTIVSYLKHDDLKAFQSYYQHTYKYANDEELRKFLICADAKDISLATDHPNIRNLLNDVIMQRLIFQKETKLVLHIFKKCNYLVSKSLICTSVSSGAIDIINYLIMLRLSNSPTILYYSEYDFVINAIKSGDINAVKHIMIFISERKFNDLCKTNGYRALRILCECGYIDILEWLILDIGYINIPLNVLCLCFSDACNSGHTPIAKFIYQTFGIKMVWTRTIAETISKCVIFNYIKTLEFLFEISKNIVLEYSEADVNTIFNSYIHSTPPITTLEYSESDVITIFNSITNSTPLTIIKLICENVSIDKETLLNLKFKRTRLQLITRLSEDIHIYLARRYNLTIHDFVERKSCLRNIITMPNIFKYYESASKLTQKDYHYSLVCALHRNKLDLCKYINSKYPTTLIELKKEFPNFKIFSTVLNENFEEMINFMRNDLKLTSDQLMSPLFQVFTMYALNKRKDRFLFVQFISSEFKLTEEFVRINIFNSAVRNQDYKVVSMLVKKYDISKQAFLKIPAVNSYNKALLDSRIYHLPHMLECEKKNDQINPLKFYNELYGITAEDIIQTKSYITQHMPLTVMKYMKNKIKLKIPERDKTDFIKSIIISYTNASIQSNATLYHNALETIKYAIEAFEITNIDAIYKIYLLASCHPDLDMIKYLINKELPSYNIIHLVCFKRSSSFSFSVISALINNEKIFVKYYNNFCEKLKINILDESHPNKTLDTAIRKLIRNAIKKYRPIN